MIQLKLFERSDFDKLMQWIDSPELLFQWAGPNFSFPLTEQQLENYLKDANNDMSSVFIYSVTERETGSVIGHISLGKIDRKNKSGRIGKVLVGNREGRGKGIGYQMINEVLKIAFEELKLHRVSLGVFEFNSSAIACYEKAGFVKEGLIRESRKFNNQYWDLWEMSILEHEWKRSK